MKKAILAATAFAALLIAGAPPAKAQGRMWNLTEGPWQGTWTRVGNSDQWDAVWTKGGQVVRARMTMQVKGAAVTILRRDTMGSMVGKGCIYSGSIKGQAASGTSKCDWSPKPFPWKAVISQ